MTHQTAHDKTALVLSGGGAYAAYEIGAMRAILGGETQGTARQPLRPDIYTGTSAGSLNASLMASHAALDPATAVDKVKHVWLDDLAGSTAISDNGVLHLRLNPFTMLDSILRPWSPLKQLAGDALAISESLLRHGAEFLRSTGPMVSRAVGLVDLSSLICNSPLRDTLKRVVDLKAIVNSSALLRIAATNWTTGNLQVFTNPDFVGEDGYAAIEASTAIPGIFTPVVRGGSTYVDGGLLMNTPMKPAIDAGATHIHIIYVDPDIDSIPLGKLQNTFAMFDRTVAISFAARTNADIENARWINEGLALVHGTPTEKEHTEREKKALTRSAAKINARISGDAPHRQLTIHRYHPGKELGDGTGLLDFGRDSIRQLIDRGYEETLKHDCEKSGCVLPAANNSLSLSAASGAD